MILPCLSVLSSRLQICVHVRSRKTRASASPCAACLFVHQLMLALELVLAHDTAGQIMDQLLLYLRYFYYMVYN